MGKVFNFNTLKVNTHLIKFEIYSVSSSNWDNSLAIKYDWEIQIHILESRGTLTSEKKLQMPLILIWQWFNIP